MVPSDDGFDFSDTGDSYADDSLYAGQVWSGTDAEPASETAYRRSRARRNDPCPCGSGKKFKHCCITAIQRSRASQRLRLVAWLIVALIVIFLLIGLF